MGMYLRLLLLLGFLLEYQLLQLLEISTTTSQ